MPLTDSAIRKATKKAKPYKLTDAKGLYVEVRPSGTKLWRYRYRIDGKENLFALGEYCQPRDGETPEQAEARRAGDGYTLEEARQERVRARSLVKQGIHPARQRDVLTAQRRAASDSLTANTFQTIAEEWRGRQGWTTRRSDLVKSLLEREVYPDIGGKPIRDVKASDVRTIMDRLAARNAAHTALLVRQYIGSIFSYAVMTERADSDPSAPLRAYVKRPPVQHKRPLTRDEIPELLRRMETTGYPVTRIAMRLLLLLFVRPTELREAAWSEFDLDAAEWKIPAERMKKREQHVVPLPPQAVALLRELQGMTGTRTHLFPNIRGGDKCMSHSTLCEALKRIGFEGNTPHGFRATAHTLLAGMGFDERIIEMQLAHAERNKTKASYNQYAYIKERRAMMDQYAGFIESLKAGNVVAIGSRAA